MSETIVNGTNVDVWHVWGGVGMYITTDKPASQLCLCLFFAFPLMPSGMF